MAIIEVSHVTKEFRLGQLHTFKQTVRTALSRVAGRPIVAPEPLRALDDLSLSIEAGEVLGIIGQNGAGKSTLLKLLAGISRPTRGMVSVKGRVAPLIEVGAGLVPDLTGRENIALNAAILGMSRKDLRSKFDEIVEFAELEPFIDTPVKRYSSGMQVRLGFSIATSVESEILIVDEVLAVGDLAFQRKCFDRMEALIKRQGRTVLLVSHNIRQVQRLCNRVILLNHGRIKRDGVPTEVCDAFYEQSDEKIRDNVARNANRAATTGELKVIDIAFQNHRNETTDRLVYDHECSITFRLQCLQPLDDVTFGFGFHTTDFLYLTTHNSEEQLHISKLPVGTYEVKCRISRLPLLPGVYSLRFGVTAGQGARPVYYGENLEHFQVIGSVPTTVREGFFAVDAKWAVAGEPGAQVPSRARMGA